MTDAVDEVEEKLESDLIGFEHDPLGFVKFAFPWGEPGTLENETGPRGWQAQFLEDIGASLRAGIELEPALREAIQFAVASGHDIGKSALVAWLILWALSTKENTRGVVTANTDTQLRTKTWPEVTKWWNLSINKHWFVCTATSIYSSDSACEKAWRIDAIPWSDHNTEAFAGLHNKGYRILFIFDEASAIADAIWEVTQGALKDEDTEMIWAVFGNPTRNTGRFRECFGRLSHRWNHRQIDSRTVEGVNQIEIKKDVEDYGENSDYIKVRVRGQFPSASSMQFMPTALISAAMERGGTVNKSDPVIVGVDVAWYGDDESVMWYRCGLDARSVTFKAWRGLDPMQLASSIAASIEKVKGFGILVDATFVDETGIGGGVVTRLRSLGYQCIGINNAATSDWPIDGEKVANKAAEMWARGRQWLRTGAIPPDDQLRQQLEGREYGYDSHNQIVLERKKDMKKRGLSSPDRADAFLLTFAYPVAERNHLGIREVVGAGKALRHYSPLGETRTGR